MNHAWLDLLLLKDEAKTMTEHISCDCKCKFNSTTCNSKQKWNNKTCQCEYKNYHKCGKDYSWNPISSVKWGLLTRNEVGLFQIFNHVKTIKNH